MKMMIKVTESVQHQFVFVILFQMLSNFRVTMFIVCYNYFAGISRGHTGFAVEFSRQIALPVEIEKFIIKI